MQRTPHTRLVRQAWIALAVVLHDHPLVRRLLAQSLSFFTRWRSGFGGEPRYPAFDPFGRHLDTRNALTGAITTKFAYDASGLLASETDGDGNVLTIQRDSNGTATAIVAPGGQRTTLAMDANGYLASATDPGGHAHSFTYSSGGLMLSHTTPKGAANGGYASTYQYDPLGRLTKDADPQGGSLSVAASELVTGVDVTVTTAEGRVSQRQMRFLPDGSQQQRLVDTAGAQTLVTAGVDGSLVTLLPDGMTTLSTLAADPRWGMQAPFVNLLTASTPGGLSYNAQSTRTTALSTPGQPLSLTNEVNSVSANGALSVNRFDAASRTITTTSATGQTDQILLDLQGRPTEYQADPAIDRFVGTRDSRGRVTRMVQGSQQANIDYDNANRVTSLADAGTNRTQYLYTGADLLQLLLAPDGAQYGFDHDFNDNVTTLTMPNSSAHSFSYDKIDQPTRYVPPANPPQAELTTYNLDSQISSITLASGRTVAASYDTGGRPTMLAYPEGRVQATYFGTTDRLSSMACSVGGMSQTTYAYDGPLLVQMTMSGATTGRYSYRYDNNLRLVGYSLDQNTETAIGRNTDGLVTGHGPFNYTRSGPAGAVSRISDGTLNIDFTYDTAGRIASRTHTIAGQQVYKIQLAYNNVGQISQRIETSGAVSHTSAYSYDSVARLKQVQIDGITTEQYGYDQNGNRTSRQLGAAAAEVATFDAQDRLQVRGSTAYQFNADGQMIQRASDTFQYTSRGELTGVNLGSGSTIGYAYDGLGRRVSRTDSAGTVQYLYGLVAGAMRVTATRSASGAVTQFFYDDYGNAFALQRNGVTTYIAVDQVGSPRVAVDATATVLRNVTYDSFGVITSDSSPGYDLPIGFAGGLVDLATGLTRFGFRDYEPASGRWSAKDSTKFGGGTNLYVYAGNNPITERDPLGLDWLDNLANFSAGFGDSITFGATGWIRRQMDGDAVDYNSTLYHTGEGVEIVGELAATLGGAALRRCAGRVVARRAFGAQARAQGRRILGATGANAVHHINTLFGHPAVSGGRRFVTSLFPTGGLPSWLYNSWFNLRQVTAAEHAALHARAYIAELLLYYGAHPALTAGRAAANASR